VVVFGEPDTDVMDVRDEWASPGFDLARDAWMLEGEEGSLRAYALVHGRGKGRDYDGLLHVRPGDSVDALAPALLERMEARTLEKTGGAPADLCLFTAMVETEMRAVLERAGYVEARTFFRMRIDLSPATRENPSLSRDIEIRPLRLGQDDRAIHAAIEESFSEHFRHAPRDFEEWWALRTQHERFDPSLFLLAWEGPNVAGALTAYDHGDIGFIPELGVLAPWRGKGVGTALLRHSFESFRARGQLKVALGVDAANESALGLYLGVGMRVDSRHHLMRRRLGA